MKMNLGGTECGARLPNLGQIERWLGMFDAEYFEDTAEAGFSSSDEHDAGRRYLRTTGQRIDRMDILVTRCAAPENESLVKGSSVKATPGIRALPMQRTLRLFQRQRVRRRFFIERWHFGTHALLLTSRNLRRRHSMLRSTIDGIETAFVLARPAGSETSAGGAIDQINNHRSQKVDKAFPRSEFFRHDANDCRICASPVAQSRGPVALATDDRAFRCSDTAGRLATMGIAATGANPAAFDPFESANSATWARVRSGAGGLRRDTFEGIVCASWRVGGLR